MRLRQVTGKNIRPGSSMITKALITAISLFVLAACTGNTEPVPAPQPTASAHPALVSLAPSNTELLLQLSADNTISGVCSNCPKVLKDWQELSQKAVVGSFVSVNLERLARIRPSAVLLVNGQEPLQSMLKKNGFNVVLLSNNRLKDIPANLIALGKQCRREKEAQVLAERFGRRLGEFEKLFKAKPVRVFYCIWPQPLLTIGNTSFLNDVVTACGGENIAANLSQPYPQFTVEKLVVADPDVIVLPYEMKGKPVLKKFPWTSLRAVKTGRLYFLPDPDNDLLARPTLRIFDGLSWLSVRLHPELEASVNDWQRRWQNTDR